MYRKEKPINLKGSASAMYNNLSVLVNSSKNSLMYVVAHKSVVDLVNASTDGATVTHRQVVCKEPSGGPAMIVQSKLVSTPGRGVLVITSSKGILMFEADSAAMLYWYAIEDPKSDTSKMSTAHSVFARGICGVLNDMLCVGTHAGNILVFHMPSKGTNITLSETLKGHHAPVCDIDSEKSYVVSSDDAGDIIVWKAGAQFQQLRRIKGDRSGAEPGYPCSSIRIWSDIIVGGFGSGHLRFFGCNSGKMWAEVAAHAKAINAIDMAKGNGMLLSTGEDAFAQVWQLKPGAEPKVNHIHAEYVADLQLQGAGFVHPEGQAFGVTGYDSNELVFYAKV